MIAQYKREGKSVNKRLKFIGLILFVVVLTFANLLVPFSARAEGTTIWTDKADYSPGEIVTIYGEGFQGTVTLTVVRPDGSVDSWTIEASENGNFETTYQLDGIVGEYTVTAKDGINTATTTFTDGPLTYNPSRYPATGSAQVAQGSSISFSLTITPDAGRDVTYTPCLVALGRGIPEEWISFSPQTLKLSAGQSGTTIVTISVPSTATLGNYGIKIKFKPPPGEGSPEGDGCDVYITVISAYTPEADLSITKSGPDYAHVGDKITYTFTVTNNGPDEAENVVVTDSVLGVIYGPKNLANGASETFTVEYTVTGSDPDPLENTATVRSDTSDPDLTNNKASWTVDILHPAIDVSKSANVTEAHAGDAIKYTIVVHNTGDCTLYDVNVTDTFLGTTSIGTLDADENKVFTLTYTVKVGDPDPLENTATASGKDVLGEMVTATDTATVDLIAKICGYKFHDANANGVWDEGEQGLSGWTIELWKGGEKIAETTTGSDGSYCFDELDAGEYVVKEVAQPYWRCTTGNSITVELKSGEISENNNFGNIELGSISGAKFYDANVNGVWDSGEPPIEGWKVHLTGTNILGETIDKYAFTDADGKFIFKDLLPGTYTVEEVFPSGMWVNTTATSFNHELEEGGDYVGPNFGNVCLMPGTGGKTLGFWSNKNGQALITSDDVTELNALNLYKPDGWTYPKFSTDIATAGTQIKNYLLNATAKDMCWMLSAQLIATKLNVLHGFLSGSTIVYVGPSTYVPSGFISIDKIMEKADTALLSGTRAEQEYWKNLLDGVNNNRLPFVCPEPCYPIVYP
jgi:uncharacterized repeat protein (TIGR01451 family)